MNPWIHAILSFIIPGLGQAVSSEYLRGILLFIGALVICLVNMIFFGNSLIGNVIGIIYALGAAYDAYTLADIESWGGRIINSNFFQNCTLKTREKIFPDMSWTKHQRRVAGRVGRMLLHLLFLGSG